MFIPIILLLFSLSQPTESILLRDANLTAFTYDEIHKLAVTDQVQNYLPAQKSLQTRFTMNLDGLYDFCIDDLSKGFTEHWHSRKLRDKCNPFNFYRMPVPSAFNEVVSNRTVKDYVGWFWYQTSLNLKQAGRLYPPEQLFLQFESVNYMTLVWLWDVDKQKSWFVGSHVGGHLPFIFNITDIDDSQPRESGLIMTIAVSNLLTRDTIPSGQMLDLSEQVGRRYFKFQPDFDFFHFAGIMGSVNLMKLGSIHITRVDYIPSMNPSQANLNVCLNEAPQVLSEIGWADSMRVTVHFLTDSNSVTSKAMRFADYQKCRLVRINLHDVKSWMTASGRANHFNSLVKVRIVIHLERVTGFEDKIFDSKIGFDSYELNVGLRDKVLIDHHKGYIFNGPERQLQGFGMHQEQLFSGRTMSEASIMKDIYLLKQLGANVIRTSHYPYSTEYLDACDENGILVIAECPAVGLNSFSELKLMLHKQILLEMMQRDHHHPSIIMWSVANEPRSDLNISIGYFDSLLEYARNNLSRYTVDAGRPLTAAIAQSHKDDKIGQLLDVIMINRYYAWYDFTGVIEAIRKPLTESLEGWSRKYPGKGLLVSEFGADTVAGLHLQTGEIFSEEFQRKLLIEYERVFDDLVLNKSSNMINFWGSMIWNFADFSTHESLLRVGGNRKGIMTKDREPKTSMLTIKEIYLNRTRLSPAIS